MKTLTELVERLVDSYKQRAETRALPDHVRHDPKASMGIHKWIGYTDCLTDVVVDLESLLRESEKQEVVSDASSESA